MPGLGSDISWLIYWAKDASQHAPNMSPCMSLIYTTNIWRYHPLGRICQQSLTNTKSKGTRILQPLSLSKGYSHLTASMTSLQHKGGDDSNLFQDGESLNEIESILNEELDEIVKWLKVNKLTLNVDKTQCMLFTRKKCNTKLSIKLRTVL